MGRRPSHPTTTNTTTPPAQPPPTQATTTLPVAVPTVQPVAWRACTGTDGPTGEDCATVQVPLNYADPNGRPIGIAMVRHRATGAKLGSLVANPGGPGVSGIDDLPFFTSILSTAVKQQFDIVTFDPRGVGRTMPVKCATGPQLDQFLDLDPAPTTAAGFQALEDGARAFGQKCLAKSGSVLPFVGTDSAARDLEEIRQAVGDPKLTYLGFSYGTLLGETYADLYPTHIRAMVLDGVENPALGPIDLVTQQAVGLDQQLGAFFTWCSTHTCSWHPGGDLHAAYDTLMARISANRIAGMGPRKVGPGQAFLGVAGNLYAEENWPYLADALNKASAGDGSLLLQTFDAYSGRDPAGAYNNEIEANDAIGCMDQPWPRDPVVVMQAAVKAKQRAPAFGVDDLLGGMVCSFWPVPPTGHPHPVTAAGSPPIVVVGTTGDPVTPYSAAQAVAGQLAHAVLITRTGNGHTAYRSSKCVRDAVDAYFTAGTPPAAGLTCPTP